MLKQLTPREKEFLSLLALGLDNEEIAQKMDITITSTKNYQAQIYEKLGYRDIIQKKSIYRLRAALAYQNALIQEAISKNKNWEKLFELMDSEGFYVKDFLAVVCSRLLRIPSDNFEAKISLSGVEFDIGIKKTNIQQD